MAFNVTDAAFVLKNTYAKKLQAQVSRDRKLLSHMRRVGGFTGTGTHYVAVRHSNPQSIGGVFATAQTNAGNSDGEQFAVTRVMKYGVTTLAGEFLLSCDDDEGAFVRGVKEAMDSLSDEFGHRMSIDCYGTGNGYIGQRASISSGTVTLAVADDAKNFQVGMYVTASDNDGSLSARTGTTYVTKVDEDAGTVTLADQSQLSSFSNDDYLYPAGDKGAVIKGLQAWIPKAAPTSGTTFFGVERTNDVARLAGSRVTDTALPLEEAILNLCTLLQKRGSKAKHGYLNPLKWNLLQKKLGAKIVRDQGGQGVMGFEALEVATPIGPINFYSDPDCPLTAGWIIDHRGCFLKHVGELPHIVMDDGNKVQRQASADGIELRMRAGWQMVFDAPAWSGCMSLSSSY